MEIRHHTFLNLEPGSSDLRTRGALVLPLPLDISASWKRGTDEGPRAIIEASHHIEHHDDEVGFEVHRAIGGIATHPTPELSTDPARAALEIEELAGALVDEKRLMVSLGGEHSVTPPVVRAHRRAWPDLCVLQIDAHADLRSDYKGSPHNHGCAMRPLVEQGVHVTGVGIRSMDRSEEMFVDGPGSRLFLGSDVSGRLEERAAEIIDSLPSRDVYLTIDLDGLDPSVVPAVGTPVPGGLGWWETLAFLRLLARSRNLVGADVVELSPREGLHYADSAAARLVFKILAYVAEAGTAVVR